MTDTRTELADPNLDLAAQPPQSRGGLQALFDEVNALALRLKRSERSLQSEDISALASQHVLQILSQSDGQTVPQIARVHATSRQNIQILVNRLRDRGCVELTSNPAHKRSVLVRLTARGRALLATALSEQEKFRAGLVPHFSGPEIDGAVRLLGRLRQLLGAGQTSPEPAATGPDEAPDKLPQRARHKKPVPNVSRAEPTPASWQHQSEDNELPVNLL